MPGESRVFSVALRDWRNGEAHYLDKAGISGRWPDRLSRSRFNYLIIAVAVGKRDVIFRPTMPPPIGDRWRREPPYQVTESFRLLCGKRRGRYKEDTVSTMSGRGNTLA